MHKQGIVGWLLLFVVSGCSLPGIPGAPRFAQKAPVSPQEQLAAYQQPKQEKEGFAERVVNYLTPGDPKTAGQDSPSYVNPAYSKLDPIALVNKPGPPSADLYFSLAEMSDQGANAPHARSMYQKALSIDPRHREAMLGLARLEDREGRLPQAIHVYKCAASAYPQDAKIVNDLALCHARNKDLQLSAQLLEKAIKIQPEKKLYRNNIAKVLVEMNHLDAAVSHLSAVHSPAIAHYNMGFLLQQRGRTSEAREYLMSSMKLDPQFGPAHTLIAQLGGAAGQLPHQRMASNDHILPTPMAAPTQYGGAAYPATGVSPITRVPVPVETARAPMGSVPLALPATH